jgi:hypothetical protein
MDRANWGADTPPLKDQATATTQVAETVGFKICRGHAARSLEDNGGDLSIHKDAESELGGGQFLNFRNGTHGQMNQFLT